MFPVSTLLRIPYVIPNPILNPNPNLITNDNTDSNPKDHGSVHGPIGNHNKK